MKLEFNKCFVILLVLSITILTLTSTSNCTSKPSEDQLAKDIREGRKEKASKTYAQPIDKIFRFIVIKKDNASSSSKNHYKIEFSGTVESLEGFFCSTLYGITLNKPISGTFKHYQKGSHVSYKGTVNYELTENGWRLISWSFAPNCILRD